MATGLYQDQIRLPVRVVLRFQGRPWVSSPEKDPAVVYEPPSFSFS